MKQSWDWMDCAAAPEQSPSTSRLPTLDPNSLFAASILQASRVPDYSICAPSSLLHSRVPCLEETASGVTLAQDLNGIERYARKHTNKLQSLLDSEEDAGDTGDREGRRRWAQRKALERYILSTLHPLVHQLLFSQDLYSKHTSRLYQSGLSILNRGSLISRLRREMRQRYAMKVKAMENSRDTELCAILAESNSAQYIREEEEKERQDLADRGGIARGGKSKSKLPGIRGDGLLQEEKAAAARAFSEMRLRAYASKIFDLLTEALGSDEYYYGSNKPSLLDLRLFSLLAPVLLPSSSYPSLATCPITLLLHSSYPTLVRHSERVQKLIWPIEVQPVLEASTNGRGNIVEKHFVNTPGWPTIAGRQDETDEGPPAAMTIRLASGLGRVCGQMYYYTTSMLSTVGDQARHESKEEVQTETRPKPVMTQAEKAEARRVFIGRWIWISSAVIGLIGTAFASGLLSVEVVEEDDGEEGEREVAQFFSRKLNGQAEQEKLVDDNAEEVDDEEEYEIIVEGKGDEDDEDNEDEAGPDPAFDEDD